MCNNILFLNSESIIANDNFMIDRYGEMSLWISNSVVLLERGSKTIHLFNFFIFNIFNGALLGRKTT
jgi:hypothetical protein